MPGARGKVALVTGGSRRIGAAISRALAKAGYEVVLTYLASAPVGKSLAARIGGSAVPLDLSRPSTFGRFADRLARKFGRLDLLVHNAAVFPRTPVGEVPPAAWDAVFLAAYDDFCKRVDAGEETIIDPYASDDPAEFFAVVSEHFFETPDVVDREYPELYALLRTYYRQDPLSRLTKASSAPSTAAG